MRDEEEEVEYGEQHRDTAEEPLIKKWSVNSVKFIYKGDCYV